MLYLRGSRGEKHDLLLMLNKLHNIEPANKFKRLVQKFRKALEDIYKIRDECRSMAYSRMKKQKKYSNRRLNAAKVHCRNVEKELIIEINSAIKLIPKTTFYFADEYVGVFDYNNKSDVDVRLIAKYLQNTLPSGDKAVC